MASISAVAVIKMYCCVLMKRNSATMKSAAYQRLTLPLSAAWAPELIAVSIAAVLMPPSADMTISRSSEPYISRRTRLKKDIGAM